MPAVACAPRRGSLARREFEAVLERAGGGLGVDETVDTGAVYAGSRSRGHVNHAGTRDIPEQANVFAGWVETVIATRA